MDFRSLGAGDVRRAARVRRRRAAGVALVLGVLAGLPMGSASAATGCAPATQSASTITADETWTQACSPYIVTANVTVRDGATLTIEPGVEVRFNSSRFLTISTTTLDGGLVAVGTAQDPIVFTSNLASPYPGSWRGLVINRRVLAGSALSNVLIEYAGAVPALKLDRVPSTAMTFSNIEIRECNREGVSVIAEDPVLDGLTVDCPAATKHGVTATLGADPTISNSTISNAMLISHEPTSGDVTNTTFTDYDAGLPFDLHPGWVGPVLGQNTVQGATASSAVLVVAGNVTRDATWPAFSYRLSGTVHVRDASGPMLTIEAGAELRFNASRKLLISSSGLTSGGITAVGTQSDPIVFRSNDATPAPGDWAGIQLNNGLLPTSQLEHVVIEHTGTGPALEVIGASASVVLQHGTIQSCNGEGIRIDNGEPVFDDWSIDCSAGSDVGILTANAPELTLTASTIANGMDLGSLGQPASVSGNTFTDYDGGPPFRLPPDLVVPVFADNTVQGLSATSVVEVAEGDLTMSATWPVLRYRALGNIEVLGAASPVLTLQPGTRIAFPLNDGLLIGGLGIAGGLQAIGTQSDPIVFTSDDPTPAPGDWRGVRFLTGALDDSRLEWVQIEYAGSSIYPGVEIYGADVTIENATIENNAKDGVTIREASPTIRASAIRDNGDDGIECTVGSTPGYRPRVLGSEISGNTDRGVICRLAMDLTGNTITGSSVGVQITSVEPLLRLRNNDLSGNTTTAVQNDDSGDGVDARVNWFGSASSPSSLVQGNVLLNPWLGAAPASGLAAVDASVSPESFVPLDNTSTLAAQLSEAASWTLDVKDSLGATVRSFSGSGAAVAQPWDGADGTATAVADGTYTLELSASVGGGGSAAALIGEVSVAGGLLVAKIDDPTPLEVVPGAVVTVQGSAGGTSFASYTLDYALGAEPGTSSFTQVAAGSSPVAAGTLGSWDTSGLLGGVYTLRLRSSPTSGNAAEDRITVKVLHLLAPDHDDHFSPNGDLVQDTSRIEATATVDTDWTITLLDDQSQPVKTLEGDGTVVRVFWDGSTSAGPVAPDGAYTYSISAAGGLDEIGGGPTHLDTTAPEASFASPTPGSPILTYAPLPITGTASDLHFESYDLGYGVGATPSFTALSSGSSPIVGGTLGSLPEHAAESPNFTDESVTVRLTVRDLAGNESVSDLSLSAELIAITDVSQSAVPFDPYLDEEGTVSYRLNRSADVTIEFYRSGTTSLAATILDGAPRSAGLHAEMWDGTDESSGLPVAPNDGYFYSIVATDGAGRSARFNDPNAPMSVSGTFSDLPGLTVNGVPFQTGPIGGGAQTLGQVVDAYRNDEMHLEWLPTVSTRGESHAVVLADATQISLSTGNPIPAGVPAHRYWDGRKADGTIVDEPFDLLLCCATGTETNILFVEHAFRLDDVRTNPYVFHPVLAGATNLKYGLSEPAAVEIDVIDPNGNFLMALQESTAMASGVHELTWDGRNEQGEVVSIEGVYTLEVRATSDVSGQTHTRRVSALVYR